MKGRLDLSAKLNRKLICIGICIAVMLIQFPAIMIVGCEKKEAVSDETLEAIEKVFASINSAHIEGSTYIGEIAAENNTMGDITVDFNQDNIYYKGNVYNPENGDIVLSVEMIDIDGSRYIKTYPDQDWVESKDNEEVWSASEIKSRILILPTSTEYI